MSVVATIIQFNGIVSLDVRGGHNISKLVFRLCILKLLIFTGSNQ